MQTATTNPGNPETMPYATANDVLLRYPLVRVAEITGTEDRPPMDETSAQKALREAGQEAERLERLNTAVADASAEIDCYLVKRYPLPIKAPPPVLKVLAVEIAVYRLTSLLPKESVEDARRRYDDAIRWLEGVAAGDVQLDGSPSGSGNVMCSAPGRVFGADGLKGYNP